MSENSGASGFVPPAIADLNQWLSGYEVLDLIACGGMGAVYRARQISLDRLVAIKILPPELAVDETFRKSFEAEGKAMAKLTHSNLVCVYHFGEVSDMLYLVLEFVEGSNLFDSKADAVIDPEVAVTLIRSVAVGLAEAHRTGIVHRDIKPANILINHDLVPKLGDFGLAVPDSDIESGLMMGTPAYLAPEVKADPMSASFASDIYALGVILYEMLTGDLIEGGDEMDLSRVPALGDLQKIVRKAVDPKPLLRYQNGDDFEKALGDWIHNPKTSGLAMNTGGSRVREKISPAVTQVSGGNNGVLFGVAVLLMVGGLVWFFMGSGSKPEDESTEDAIVTLPEITDEVPLVSPKTTTVKEEAGIEKLRLAQVEVVRQLSREMAGELTQNRRVFLQVAGAEGEVFLTTIPNVISLPRHLLKGEADVSQKLLVHLQEFATSRQGEIDRKYRLKISSLHRDSLRDLRATGEELPEEIHSSWQAWVEWLGENPMEMMNTSAAGLWQHSTDGMELYVSATGQKILIVGADRGEVFLTVDGMGGISLNDPSKPGLRFPWKLRWRGDRLEGADLDGKDKVLRLATFDYATLSKVPDVSESMTKSGETRKEMETFQDSEVAALTDKYRKALIEKMAPLEEGYFRVLNTSLEKYREEVDGTAVVQIEEELEWVADLEWRQGFTQLDVFEKAGELPSNLTNQQKIFSREFKKRFAPLQRTYLRSLEEMLQGRKFRERKDTKELERVIRKLKASEGAVWVKKRPEELREDLVGAKIHTPTKVTTSTANDIFSVRRLIDGSGLADDLDDATDLPEIRHGSANRGVAWATDDFGPDYFTGSRVNSPPKLTFSFAEPFELSGCVYWGYQFTSDERGIGNEPREMRFTFYDEAGKVLGGPYTCSVTKPAGQRSRVIALPETSGVKSVDLELLDNFGNYSGI